MAKLEAETGVTLVRRRRARDPADEAGRLLADRAREILGQVEAVREELADHAGLCAGRVRLARSRPRWPRWCLRRPPGSRPTTPVSSSP